MESLAKDFKELLFLFEKHQVDYMLVGGYAVAIHGYPRYTGDLDLWFRSGKDNASHLVAALREFGIEAPDLTEALFLKPKTLLQFGREPLKVELMNHVSGLDFESSSARKISFDSGGVTIFVISKRDLIENKRAAGRTKDLADIEELEKGAGEK